MSAVRAYLAAVSNAVRNLALDLRLIRLDMKLGMGPFPLFERQARYLLLDLYVISLRKTSLFFILFLLF